MGGIGISWNISTTANVVWVEPFECPGLWANNPTTAQNVQVTAYGIVNAAAVPNTDQVWPDIEYMGSAGSPLGYLASGSKANVLASGTPWSADTSAWDSQGPVRQNSHSYSVGNSFTVASNPGRRFWVISGSGNTASSDPGYSSVTDGNTIVDGGYTVRAGCRFVMTVTLSTPQPQLAGYLRAYIKAALPSSQWYVDPLISVVP